MTVLQEAKRPDVDQDTSLLQAVLAVQAEAPVLPKDKTNPHFGSKFTGLETIVETIGPILSKHGLIWIALPAYHPTTGAPELHYQLIHAKTGQSISGSMPLFLAKNDSQGLGSALTYARRYAMTSVLNLVADEDDDGNAASDPSGPAAGGDTVNLQNEAKGLRNEAINQAFSKAGLPPSDKPWGPLGRVPSDHAEALRDALSQLQAMA
jgi:hypothetical protein